MRLYYVVTDTSPAKKNTEQRRELLDRMAVRDLEANAPNRTFQVHKTDATGTRWFGGIDLDAPTLVKLNDRRKGEPDTQRKLAALLQAELRAALPAGERGQFTVEVVAADSDPLRASQAAMQWLAVNWSYPPDPSRSINKDTKR